MHGRSFLDLRIDSPVYFKIYQISSISMKVKNLSIKSLHEEIKLVGLKLGRANMSIMPASKIN